MNLIFIMPSYAQAYVVMKGFFLEVYLKDKVRLTPAGTLK